MPASRLSSPPQDELSFAGDLRAEGLCIQLKHAGKFRFGAGITPMGKIGVSTRGISQQFFLRNTTSFCFGKSILFQRVTLWNWGRIKVITLGCVHSQNRFEGNSGKKTGFEAICHFWSKNWTISGRSEALAAPRGSKAR